MNIRVVLKKSKKPIKKTSWCKRCGEGYCHNCGYYCKPDITGDVYTFRNRMHRLCQSCTE